MENKINQTDLAAALSRLKGITKKDAEKFMDEFFSVIEEYIIRDKIVKVKGLGTFKIIDVNDRESVNVNTGERIVIAGHSKLSFTPDSTLKDAVNSPFADFETVALSDNVNVAEMENTESKPEAPAPEAVKEEAPAPEPVKDEAPVVETKAPVVETKAPVVEPVTPAVEPVKEKATIAEKPVEPKPENKPEGSPEGKAAAKAAAAAAEAAAKAAAAVAEAAAKATPAPAPEPAPVPKKHTAHAWIWAAVTVILVLLGYFAGSRQILPISVKTDTQKTETVKPETKAAPKPAAKPAPKAEKTPEELAKQYPQVEGGEYLIIGELDHVHHMRVGETLYRIAGKELGSQKLMPYIMVFNNYPNDIVLHPDDPIRLPKLIKKN